MNPFFPNIAATPIAPATDLPAVNLPFAPTVDSYGYPSIGTEAPPMSIIDELNAKANSIPFDGNTSPVYKTRDLDLSGRFPKIYLEGNNEEIYAQSQGGREKVWNGVVKMSGLAASTFINGTVGLVYGVGKAVQEGKFSSLYDNELSRGLNEWTNSLENSYAHYKTIREKEANWWEPVNLFSGNFFMDGVIKNLGFSIGAMAGGFAWEGAFKLLGLTSRLTAMGANMAAKVDQTLGEVSALAQAERMAVATSKLGQLWEGAAPTIGKGLMKADRAIVATMGSIGEGGIEALNNSQEFRKKMISDFEVTHGYSPSKEQIEEINGYAEKVGNWSLGLNVALLSVTNYIQLPKIFSSTFKGEKQIVNNMVHTGEKYISSLPEKGFGKLLYKTKNAASLFFNTAEAFEEGAQFTIQTGTQNYNDRKFRGEESSVLDDGLLYGIKETLTTNEGTLNIFLGGFSGALQSSGTHTLGRTGKIGQRGVFGYGGTEGTLRTAAIDVLNKTQIKESLKATYNGIKAAESIQNDRTSSIEKGDILESKDLEHDYAHNFIASRLNHGAKQFILDEINDLKTQIMSPEGFLKLQKEGVVPEIDTKEAFTQRLDNLLEHADNVEKMQSALNIKYGGKIDPVTKKLLYSKDVLDKAIYAGSKILDYNKRIPQLQSELLGKGVIASQILNEILSTGDISETTSADVKKSIADITGISETEKKDIYVTLRDFTELALRKKQFLNEYDDILTNPLKNQEQKVTTPKPTGEKIIVTDKTGEREVEIGEEYYLGAIEYTDGDGVKKKRFPRITILGENENGTIKIKDASGKIRDIDKKELESYKLGKVKDTEKSENSSYYFRNVIKQPDNEFFWNIGKAKASKEFPDGIIPGRLEYDNKTDKLTFVYTQNGKRKEKEIGIDQFTPKEEFKQGVFFSKNRVTGKENELSVEDQKNINDRKTSGKTAKDIKDRRGKRLEVLNQIGEEIRQKYDNAISLVSRKRSELENIEKQLDKVDKQIANIDNKDVDVNNITNQILKDIERLSTLKTTSEKEITTLEEEKSELEMMIPYLEGMSQNLDELPELGSELLQQFKQDRELLQELILNSEVEIESINKIIPKIQQAIDSAFDFLRGIVTNFQQKFPKIVNKFSDILDIDNTWAEFVRAHPYFLKSKPDYTEDLKSMYEMMVQIQELDIKPDQRTINELQERVKELTESVKQYEAQLNLNKLVSSKFEDIAKQHQEEKTLANNAQLQKDLLGTNTTEKQNNFKRGEYEPNKKKSVSSLINGTVLSTKDEAEHEHYKRANRFGFKFGLWDDKKKDEYRRQIVTLQTEEHIGLKGLISKVYPENKRSVDSPIEKVILTVIVDKYGNLVGEDGNVLTEEQLQNPLEHTIYEVHPDSHLTGKYLKEGEKDVWETQTRFRKNEDETVVENAKAQYVAWRQFHEQQTTLPEREKVNASFGIIEYVKNDKGETDYNARTPVTSTGLVTEKNLKGKNVLVVATDAVVHIGESTFENAAGKVFLAGAGAGVPLQNRTFNEKEANALFEVIEQVCKNKLKSVDNKTSKEEKDKATLDNNNAFFPWLKSMIHWGIPRDYTSKIKKAAGYNSVWFETVEEEGQKVTKLFISGIGTAFDFTPSSLQTNKSTIISLFRGMYNNVDRPLTTGTVWKNPYQEILGIDKEGNTIKGNWWENYQSYLLSSEGRKAEDVPLTTFIKPIKGDEINRHGIYFIGQPTERQFEQPKPKKDIEVKEKDKQKSPTEEILYSTPAVLPKKFVTDGENRHMDEGELLLFDAKMEKIIAKPTEISDRIRIQQGNAFYDNELNDIERFVKARRDGKETRLFSEWRKDTRNTQKKEAKGFVLDGTTVNTVTLGEYGEAAFKLSITDKIFVIEKVEGAVIQSIMDGEGLDKEGALAFIQKEIFKQVKAAPKQTPVVPIIEEEEIDEDLESRMNNGFNDSELREQVLEENNKFETEDWPKVEQWLKANFPNIPVYRVKNIIQATNGKKTWGMLHKAAIYLYEGAETGTVYHEVFEAVWKSMATNVEKAGVIKEFKNREGNFVDRVTKEKIQYKDATNEQLKEELAEEFRDFVLYKKLPEKSGKNFIVRLFNDLVNFFKEFFTGEKALGNTQALFEKIGSGYYRNNTAFASDFSVGKIGMSEIENIEGDENSDYRLETIPSEQQHQIIQHMTYQALIRLIQTDEGLFSLANPDNVSKEELYNNLFEDVLSTIATQAKIHRQAKDTITFSKLKALFKDVKTNRKDLEDKFEEHLLSYGIEFDENDELALTEDKTKEDPYGDARKIDSFRKMNAAVKLLFATLPVVKNGKIVRNSIGGVNILPMGEVFVTLKGKLFNSRGLDEMIQNLGDLALNNPNYLRLYRRIMREDPSKDHSFSHLDENGLMLVSAFWNAMKSQNPDVLTLFILSSGEASISDTSLATAAKQAKQEITSKIINNIKEGKEFFSFNKKLGTYSATKKLRDYTLTPSNLSSYTEYLKELGVEFNPQDIKGKNINDFKEAVQFIHKSLLQVKDISTISTHTLNLNKRLLTLGNVQASIKAPDYDITYFNMNGDQVQAFIGTNAVSHFYDVMSQITKLSDLDNTDFAYLRTDVNSKGSVIIRKMFDEDGNKKEGYENILAPVFSEGTDNEPKGKEKESSRLNIKERLIQELSMNSEGVYNTLVPGDASIEHGERLHDKGSEFVTRSEYDSNEHLNVFREYFISEVELSREERILAKGRQSGELRFFTEILGEEVAKKLLQDKNKTSKEIYNNNKSLIDGAVNSFLKQEANDLVDMVEGFGILVDTKDGVEATGLTFVKPTDTKADVISKLELISLNYIIANIEFHKLIFSDPYLYADELKRIKNFLSPRQPLIYGSTKISEAFHQVYNKGYEARDIGYSDMDREEFRSITMADILSSDPLYDKYFEETDGGGKISMKANRIFRLRAKTWTPANEKQYRYDIAYEKHLKGIPLSPEEQKIFDPKKQGKDNPGIKDTYTTLKPIVAGNKANGRNYNDILLDKFALVVLSYRIQHQLNPNSNAVKLYNKWQAEGIDYGVFASGRKVGAEVVNELYVKGEFNIAPYTTNPDKNKPQAIINVPFSIISVQTEVPSKDINDTTQGSQITKLVTIDFMEAGVPLDFMEDTKLENRYTEWIKLDEEQKLAYNNGNNLYKEIKHNQSLLEERIEIGLNNLFKKTGIIIENGKYVVSDKDKLYDTLRRELLRMEVNENVIAFLKDFKDNDVVLESTPAYQQLRHVLMSIAEKNVVKQKINGGMKVQIDSGLLEENRVVLKEIKDKEGNTKQVYQSDILKFYRDKDGERVCEIMLARWFKSDKTDEELLKYFNETEEGQKVLKGVAFRIPTQKQNSIDVFKIAQFLPKDFGDNVVVPSALVKKVGSDFDIDKLSLYFKNVFKDAKGNIRTIPFFGYGENAKTELKEEILHKKEVEALEKELSFEREHSNGAYEIVRNIFGEYGSFTEDEIISDFLDRVYESDVKTALVEKTYKQSIENEYIESLERLISHPKNFENLTGANSAQDLQDLTDKINDKKGRAKTDYKNVGNMLKRRYMSLLRNDFVTGKQAIGIAAVSQTNHAQNQRTLITIDTTREIPADDKQWIGDGKIRFKEYNSINGMPTLSMIKNCFEKVVFKCHS